jgi:hypothetical protein
MAKKRKRRRKYSRSSGQEVRREKMILLALTGFGAWMLGGPSTAAISPPSPAVQTR